MLTPKKLHHLKNEMLVANCLANLIGVVAVNALMFVGEGFINKKLWQHPVPFWIDTLFTPFAFIFVCGMTLQYERPIRRYLTALYKKTPISAELAGIARQRLLNEPFVLISYDFSMWLLSAIVYPMLHWIYNSGPTAIQSSLYHGLSAGVITITVAFFLLEHILQKKLTPYFFPQGGLYAVPKTLRIRIRTRLAALLFACNLIPLFSIILATHLVAGSTSDAAVALVTLRKAIITNAAIFILAGIYLIGLVSRNLTMPFAEIIQTLQGVRNGKFDKKVRVTSNDEIGYTGDVINEMTDGLRERDRIRRSLGIAMEVQQHLLPRYAPKVEGLDIAGQSLYCEETGGDYFDYLPIGRNGQSKIKIMVGDVSDHGIASALLMTTARAFLRQRASRKGNLSQIVTDVNRQLSGDVEDSGRFMTLFICEIDGRMKTIRWVNAGHDPAVIFDQYGGDYEELAGRALPLGVSDKASYQEFQRRLLPGQIILIGTDGIWESQNSRGQMFGKKRFRDVVRTQTRQPAAGILQAVITALDDFCHPLAKEDDVTLVVVKVEE
jgi:serine phosphatase RsbU (regulator of sigma subunit)